MPKQRPCVLTVAGFDPSGGAGVLADIKTFEMHRVMGLAATTAITYQNEQQVEGVDWLQHEQIQRQIAVLCQRYTIATAKIGLVENLAMLACIVDTLLSCNASMRIVWDPIVQASSGFAFHAGFQQERIEALCRKLFLATPNRPEMQVLCPALPPEQGAEHVAQYCSVLLKGGHNTEKVGYDTLYSNGKQRSFRPKEHVLYPKHGSGCVLSAAIVANTAKGYPLHKACLHAKTYTTRVLVSNTTLLGYHNR